MSGQDLDESVLKADRYSKVIAVFYAGAVFALALVLTDDMTFNMTVAGVSGIGIRLYIPYHASVVNDDGDGVPIREFGPTGDYNHGAVGGGLVLGALVALAVMTVDGRYPTAMLAGLVAVLVAYRALVVLLE